MLDVANLCAGYGKLPVLRDAGFTVEAGQIVLIAGENGAGKSTLLRTIAGLIRPTSGTIRFQGRDVAGETPEVLVARGLRLVLDGHRIFPGLTVYDNIRLGAVASRLGGREFARALEQIYAVFPILKERSRARARSLSGGQQQMLTLSQAFVARPKVLLCDEPSLGLAMSLMPPIMDFLRQWAASGTAVVVVEQHIDLALQIADRALLLEHGSFTFAGAPDEFRAIMSAKAAVPSDVGLDLAQSQRQDPREGLSDVAAGDFG